jgi:3,4-dihydroxy 2-butanone 4-phosphate synthase/GTP cyclohydrolase II
MSAGARLDAACAQIASGGMVLLSGDALRGGDIDFVAAARSVTAAQVNFMAMHGRGLICLALTPERALHLGISLLNSGSAQQSGRPFGQSIEAREGVDTGISAADRAHTISVAVAESSTSDDIATPGHVFPLITRSGGVLKRPAAAEAAIELCRLAGAGDAAVLCSVMREDGTMARIEDMQGFAHRHCIPILDLRDIIGHLQGEPQS